MTETTFQTLGLLMLAAVASPLLSDRLARWIILPTVALELLFGVLLGPSVLGWATTDTVVSALSDLGLAMLMFMAGYEIEFRKLRGGPLRTAIWGWLLSLLAGLGLAATQTGLTSKTTLVVGLAMTTTALGTLLPIIRDRGLLGSRFGTRVMAIGAIGEFAPIVAISIVLTTDRPWHAMLLLAAFVLIAVTAAALARRPAPARLGRVIETTLTSSGQLVIRLTMLLIITLMWIADEFHLDTLLGSFAAGIVVRLAFQAAPHTFVEVVESKLDAIGFGFLIPIFFVVSGLNLDLGSLSTVSGLLLTGLLLCGFLIVRGGPVLLLERGQPARKRSALALLAGSALPLIVVITSIGLEENLLTAETAAALVAAGALSVLIFPQVGLRLLDGGGRPAATPPEEPEAL